MRTAGDAAGNKERTAVMRKIIFLNLLVIGLVGVLFASASTFAYFSDDATDTGASFRSGTLDVQLSNNGGASWADNVSAAWVTPSNWAPGDTADLTLFYKNNGSVSAHSGLIDYQYNSCAAGNIFPKIQVVSWQESFDGGSTWPIENIVGGNYSVFDRNGDGKMSLQELIDGDSWTPGTQSPSPYDVAWYTPADNRIAGVTGDHGAWGRDDDIRPFGNPDLLPAGGSAAGMKLTLKFMEDAGNAYQGLSCSMNISAKFVQVPGRRPWTSLAGY